MRIEWLNKNNTDRVIIFFNGWGMDAAAISHLVADTNLMMLYDYRNLEIPEFPDWKDFREIAVVAWSMGVWAAEQVLPLLPVHPNISIAFNGTGRPVDDRYGIPCKIYQLTEKGMSASGQEKFMKRMFVNPEERERFEKNKPSRKVPEVCEELTAIRKQSTGTLNTCLATLKWDKAYISEQDAIFPVQSQLNWWQERAPIGKLAGGHYPFYHFRNWEEVIRLEKV